MNKDDKSKSELHTGHQWQEEIMMDSTSQSVASSGEATTPDICHKKWKISSTAWIYINMDFTFGWYTYSGFPR